MNKKKVVSVKNLPAKLPIWPTLTTYLALDYWHAPEWLYGGLGILFLLLWISCICSIVIQEQTDIFK